MNFINLHLLYKYIQIGANRVKGQIPTRIINSREQSKSARGSEVQEPGACCSKVTNAATS